MEMKPGYHILHAESAEALEQQVNEILVEASQHRMQTIFCGGVTSSRMRVVAASQAGVGFPTFEEKTVLTQALFLALLQPAGLLVPTLGPGGKAN
jgi:hypothetical protein